MYMSQSGNSGIGRIYIKVGSEIIDLSGSTKEVRDDWLEIKEDESWEGMLTTIRNARDSAVQTAAAECATAAGPQPVTGLPPAVGGVPCARCPSAAAVARRPHRPQIPATRGRNQPEPRPVRQFPVRSRSN